MRVTQGISGDARLVVYCFVCALCQVPSLNDKSDYRAVEQAIRTVGFADCADTLWRTLAAIIHLVGTSLLVCYYKKCTID